jgi:hypothetical protein
VSFPEWSPNGRWITFLFGQDGTNLLVSATPSDSGHHVLTDTHTDTNFGRPVWSPEGDLIAFARPYAGSTSLWTIDATGNQPAVRIAGFPGFDAAPIAWQPVPTVPSSPQPPWKVVASDQLPWTVEAPELWHMTFERSPSRPNLKTGVLQSWIGTAQFRPEWMTGPTLAAGATERLGPAAVMVHIGLFFYPPDQQIAWSPDPSVPPTWTRDYGEHPDSQNPGWVIHERQLCQGKECVNVLIWHGPDASEADVSDAERVAQSVTFVADWTDEG